MTSEFPLPQDSYWVNRRNVWHARHVWDYFLALGKGPDYVDHFDQFPRVISPGEALHAVFNDLRSLTKDGYERHIDILTDVDSNVIALPHFVARGERSRVPGHVIHDHREKASDGGKYKTIGSLHSHPPDDQQLLERLRRKIFLSGQFSAADLFILVERDGGPERFIGVAEDQDNILAFRTHETGDRDFRDYLYDGVGTLQDGFSEYWYGRRGMIYNSAEGSVSRPGGPRITDQELWQVNLEIAQHHSLVIYRGWPSENFLREYPQFFQFRS